jgi:DNA-binding transcriptional regulator YdaS (Cro superfamily)
MSVLDSKASQKLTKKHQKQVLLAIDDAIQFFGKQAALARRLKISSAAISAWKSLKNPVPVTTAKTIEKLSNGLIKKERFRPLDWHVHWPAEPVLTNKHKATTLLINQTTPEEGKKHAHANTTSKHK